MATPTRRRAFVGLAVVTATAGLAGCTTLQAFVEPDTVSTYKEGVEQYRSAYDNWAAARRAMEADRWEDGHSHLDEAFPPAEDSVTTFEKTRKLAMEANNFELVETIEEAEASASFLRHGIGLYLDAMDEIISDREDHETQDTIEQARAYCRRSAEYEIAPVDEVRSLA